MARNSSGDRSICRSAAQNPDSSVGSVRSMSAESHGALALDAAEGAADDSAWSIASLCTVVGSAWLTV